MKEYSVNDEKYFYVIFRLLFILKRIFLLCHHTQKGW